MGTKDVPYCGTFDGAGHKISGLYVHSTANYSGLFGYCAASDSKTPVIKNLSVDNSSINVPYIYSTGGIAGFGGCYITNGYNTGELNCINTSSSGITPSFFKGVAIGEAGSNMEINNFYYSDADLPLCSGGQAITSQNTGVKTAEQFASGEVAYLLNGNTSDGSISITDNNGNSYRLTKSGNYYYVRVADIPAHLLGTPVTLTVKENGDVVGTIIYSPLSYAYSVLSAYPNDDGVHDNVRNLVKSLYQYNNKAVAYKTV